MTINRSILARAAAATIVASLWLATAATAEVVTPQAVGCKLIRNAAQLQAIQNNLAGSYCLANDIDASSIANFVPIGDGAPFTGKLFGNGWAIRNLKIASDGELVGLFGYVKGALIQDVGLVNIDVRGAKYVGGLVGYAAGEQIRRVHVTGRVAGTGGSSYVGGIVGQAVGLTLTDSWSSAAVNGDDFVGGAIGYADGGAATRIYATGPTACTGASCFAGGLIGYGYRPIVDLSYASGRVIAADNGRAGGLVGATLLATIRRSHALGAVTVGAGQAYAGGLMAYLESGTLAEVYAAGRVTGGAGATLSGLVSVTVGTLSVTSAYWDVYTTMQTASAAGAGYTTAQMRAALPAGFGNAWAITARRSYPFLNEADIDFTAPLAALVAKRRVYTFVPISQRDKSQYAAPPANAGATSLATVYTMIARAIGVTKDVAALKNVKIDRFWNDTKKIAVWRGPVTTRAALGAFEPIAANARLNTANVIGEMKGGRLVILRGTYTRSNGSKAEHWLLGTLYTASGNAPDGVIANDPWTGMQVTIDPVTKKVVWPVDFPLADFKVDGYQPVTLN